MAVAVVVTDNETGRKVRLLKDMIDSVICNSDGTSTINTKHEGSHIVREHCDLIKDSIKILN